MMIVRLLRWKRIVPIGLLLFVPAIPGYAEIVPDWSSVTTEPFVLVEPSTIENPVLSASDIDDINAGFVADPFLFFEDDSWYMFFEVFNNETNQGDIALATSKDGFHWTYQQVVIDEEFHLSYPYVFKWENEYYIVPEKQNSSKTTLLYKAEVFPFKWKLESILLDSFSGADPSLFRYNQKWWMYTTKHSESLFLYYADELKGPWKEHFRNPIIFEDAGIARSGGRSFVFDKDRIIRIAQKCDVRYGEQVRAFEVDILTENQYEEHEIFESPILTKGSGWRETGMHHFDPWWTGSYWLCAVDGDNDLTWSIGIYVTDNDTDGDGIANYIDQCINDPNKEQPGVCGCGVQDIDTDFDGTMDCNDECPNDPDKTDPGVCGCGLADTDTDNDGIPDCTDFQLLSNGGGGGGGCFIEALNQ